MVQSLTPWCRVLCRRISEPAPVRSLELEGGASVTVGANEMRKNEGKVI